MWIGLGLLITIAIFVSSKTGMGGTLTSEFRDTLLNLPDIEPDEQGGVYKRDFDSHFKRWSLATGVPFALIKAHAIRESSLKPGAYLSDRRGGSYGLMQLSWGPDVEPNRFAVFGWPASRIGTAETLYDNEVNVEIAAKLIADNLTRFKNVKDAINAYNTGVAYTKRIAPHNYTEDVIKYYETIVKRKVV